MELKIGGKTVGGDGPVFVIAEIGNNHNGSLERALQLVDLAAEMGVDCAKFQMRNLGAVYRKNSLNKSGDDLSAEYTIDLLKRFELTLDEHRKIAKHCRKKDILYLCTPWDKDSVENLEAIGVAAYKVASADLTNLPLIETLIATGKPLIFSTGMSTTTEIKKTVEFLNKSKAAFALLHCNSTYPAPFQNIQLPYLETLRGIHPVVGYSGHERGIAVSIAAVALGAKIIERHFTLDRGMEGPDHAASLEPKDFKALVEGIRQVEMALGGGPEKNISQGEMMNRENLAKSLVARRALKKGAVLAREDIDVKSPGRGLSPQYLPQLVGRAITRDMDEEEYFYMTDLGGTTPKARRYHFRRPWGVPVRYYDFHKFREKISPDLYEFHLSYSDMDLNVADFFKQTYDMDFVVHAPELFAGSHLMDLATPDEAYRAQSLRETQRVIEITRQLKKYFPKTKRPLIVANVGGFSMDKTFSSAEKEKRYGIFEESLSKLDLDGVELIPQTMAPFPWHFGGQRHQNLFVLADEMAAICAKLKLRICLDVSHSKLTCNHFKLDFNAFVEKVGPYVAHLHLADSTGVDGEGLQVGEGEIDFKTLAEALARTAPHASFIPEIWQGHKNDGEGFWTALELLEKYF